MNYSRNLQIMMQITSNNFYRTQLQLQVEEEIGIELLHSTERTHNDCINNLWQSCE